MIYVTSHAIDRLRERFPLYRGWWAGECTARIRWLYARGREVGTAPGRRYVLADGVVLVVKGRAVVSVQPAGWGMRGNAGRAVPRWVRGRRDGAEA